MTIMLVAALRRETPPHSMLVGPGASSVSPTTTSPARSPRPARPSLSMSTETENRWLFDHDLRWMQLGVIAGALPQTRGLQSMAERLRTLPRPQWPKARIVDAPTAPGPGADQAPLHRVRLKRRDRRRPRRHGILPATSHSRKETDHAQDHSARSRHRGTLQHRGTRGRRPTRLCSAGRTRRPRGRRHRGQPDRQRPELLTDVRSRQACDGASVATKETRRTGVSDGTVDPRRVSATLLQRP